jgi:superfamily II DNA or RNA helicase/ribosomal protein S27AE
MTKITLRKWENKPYIMIESQLPKSIVDIIDKVTSYKIKNAEHIDNQRYICPKCGWWKLTIHANSDYCKRCGTLCNIDMWDCIIRLLSTTRTHPKKLYFPIGLLDTVENTLHAIGYETDVTKWPLAPQEDTQELNLTWTGPMMRKHQDEAITKTLTKLKEGRGVILEMSTGSGKTTTALNILQQLKVNTLILVHKKNLMEQWENAIKTTLNWNPDLFGDNQKDLGPITIGMIQSISKTNNFPFHMFNFMIADECHHVPAESTYNLIMKSDAYYKLGLSATPTREDGNEMKMFAAIGQIIKVSSIKELIKLGILAKPTIEIINAPPGNSGSTYAESVKNQIVMNEPRNRLIAQKAYELRRKGLSILITVTQIRHGKTLEAMIKGSKFIHGKTKKEERQQAMKDFENGELNIMISTLLNEGSDIPTLDAIIMASGGKSEGAQIQKVGRALRTTKDKKTALIIDIVDSGKWLRDHAQGRIKLYQEVFGQ